MDWTQAVDGYCERLGPGLWAEPLNAASNVAFLLAAAIMALRLTGAERRSGGGRAEAWVMVALLAAVGIGSALFHTVATAWAALADVIPIGLFILVYIYAANRAFLGWRPRSAALGMLGFIPFSAAMTPVFAALPFFAILSFYWTVPLLIFPYAAVLGRRAPDTAAGMAAGGALLVLSISVRSLDIPLCGVLPSGTHFLWHVLNAVMLGWMIEVYLRHRARRPGLAAAGQG